MVVGLVEQIQNLDRSQTYTRTGVGDRFSVARNDDFLAV
jgi:hypothetical protein